MATITHSKLDTLPAGTIDTVVRHLSQNEAVWGFGVNRHRLKVTEEPASSEICPIAIMDAVEERVAFKKEAGLIEDIEPLAVQVAGHYRLAGSDCLPGVLGAGLEVALFYRGSIAKSDALRVLNFPVLQIDTWQNKHLAKVNLIIVPERLEGGKR